MKNYLKVRLVSSSFGNDITDAIRALIKKGAYNIGFADSKNTKLTFSIEITDSIEQTMNKLTFYLLGFLPRRFSIDYELMERY